MTKKYLPLILILLLAAVLRLGAISSFPSGFNADEAALGYNAYSLLLTGRDEHGNILPVNLESFGDYKPALYSYLLVPLVRFLGLTVFAVRLPSALWWNRVRGRPARVVCALRVGWVRQGGRAALWRHQHAARAGH